MATTAILPEITKRIVYNKTTKVYDCYIVLSIWPMGLTLCLGDIDFDDWRWLRSLAQTDLAERLIALARGRAE